MNNIATFDNTVGILVKAYLEGTLLKQDCCACAVGNICAAAAGAAVVDVTRFDNPVLNNAYWSEGLPIWQKVFMHDGTKQAAKPSEYKGLVKRQIDATGYTWRQLARIEKAFEMAAPGVTDAAEFAGLMAVVDVLANIHGVNLSASQAAKLLFVKA